MRILLTGASGFAGAALLPRLLEDGHEVRALARSRERVERALAYRRAAKVEDVELTIGDTLTGQGVARAMRDVEVAYYLIHSMEPAPDGLFAARERASADTFAHAARAAGVRRIVYLGGPVPVEAPPSSHLASRHAVERILLAAVKGSVTLRASIAIGARSRSFRFLVRLVERMPVLALPAWRSYRTQPVDERDVVEALARCAAAEGVAGRSLDLGGPEALSYGEMVERIAALMLLSRPKVGLPLTATPLTGRVAAAIAGEEPELVLPLMEGLTCDLLVGEENAADVLGIDLHSFDAAVEHALYEWEQTEALAAR